MPQHTSTMMFLWWTLSSRGQHLMWNSIRIPSTAPLKFHSQLCHQCCRCSCTGSQLCRDLQPFWSHRCQLLLTWPFALSEYQRDLRQSRVLFGGSLQPQSETTRITMVLTKATERLHAPPGCYLSWHPNPSHRRLLLLLLPRFSPRCLCATRVSHMSRLSFLFERFNYKELLLGLILLIFWYNQQLLWICFQ